MKTIIAITTVALGLAAGSALANEGPRADAYPDHAKPAAAASFLGGNAQGATTGMNAGAKSTIYTGKFGSKRSGGRPS